MNTPRRRGHTARSANPLDFITRLLARQAAREAFLAETRSVAITENDNANPSQDNAEA